MPCSPRVYGPMMPAERINCPMPPVTESRVPVQSISSTQSSGCAGRRKTRRGPGGWWTVPGRGPRCVGTPRVLTRSHPWSLRRLPPRRGLSALGSAPAAGGGEGGRTEIIHRHHDGIGAEARDGLGPRDQRGKNLFGDAPLQVAQELLRADGRFRHLRSPSSLPSLASLAWPHDTWDRRRWLGWLVP